MNNLTSFQRKIAYLVGIVILLVPIIWLGMPAGRDDGTGGGTRGHLAKLRQDYDLGETSLGNVDPSSSTMNLVLLGFRGVATNLLWQNAMDQKDRKQWAQLRSTVDSIKLLQPHYIKVWDFQSWNLAYNVSAEWDNVEDRYYWVKEGGKFLMEGTERNRRNPDLAFKVGYIQGQKVGRADESQFFREYFRNDPDDDRFGDKPDAGFNRGPGNVGEQPDNYLAAREWHVEANRREEQFPPQRIMMRELFRSYPAKAYMEMANALQKEGVFDERDAAASDRRVSARGAWEDGYRAWVDVYGREEFPSEVGPIRLDLTTNAEFAEVARRNGVPAQRVKDYVNYLQNTTNYRYWKERSLAESKPGTATAHREVFEGQRLFREGKLNDARQTLLSGLEKLEAMFDSFPKLEQDDTLAVEEALMAMIYLREIYELNGEPVPADLPLQRLWIANESTGVIEQLREQFKTQTAL